MISPALNRGIRKLGRTFLQVVASGGATVIVDVIANGLGPQTRMVWTFAWLMFFTFAQNTLETKGIIPTLFPAPGLITERPGGIVGKTVGTISEPVGDTIDTITDAVIETGEVVGAVVDTTGEVVGAVVDTTEKLVSTLSDTVEKSAFGDTVVKTNDSSTNPSKKPRKSTGAKKAKGLK